MAEPSLTRNSSITRVRPFFGQLFDRDATGASWLPMLLSGDVVPGDLQAEPGAVDPALLACRHYGDRVLKAKLWLRRAFEYSRPPTEALLAWCLDDPSGLDPPKDLGSTSTPTSCIPRCFATCCWSCGRRARSAPAIRPRSSTRSSPAWRANGRSSTNSWRAREACWRRCRGRGGGASE